LPFLNLFLVVSSYSACNRKNVNKHLYLSRDFENKSAFGEVMGNSIMVSIVVRLWTADGHVQPVQRTWVWSTHELSCVGSVFTFSWVGYVQFFGAENRCKKERISRCNCFIAAHNIVTYDKNFTYLLCSTVAEYNNNTDYTVQLAIMHHVISC